MRGDAVRGTVVAEGKLPVLRHTGGFDSLEKADSQTGTAIRKEKMMGQLIGMIVTGAVIGALARLFKRGEQPIGILWTIILGALGAGIGGWLVGQFGYTNANGGGQWIQWSVSIIVAMILIGIYMGATGKKK